MQIFQLKVRLTSSLAALALAAGTLAGCSDSTAQAYAEGQKAQAALDAGDLPGASAAIGRALALRGDQLDLLLLDGRIRYRANDFNGAFNSYSMALAIDAMNPEALQAVSQMGSALGAETEALSAAERILTTDPNNSQALLVKGMQRLGRRDYAGAGAIADRMLAANAQDETGIALKARALMLGGQVPAALKLLDDALKRTGPNRMLSTALLETARDQGDSELMLRQFATLRQLVPDNVDLTIDEANVRYKRGDLAGARALGATLLRDQGQDDKVLRRLADLWAEYDRTPLSAAQLDALGADGPLSARLAVARHYLTAGDTATAKALVGSAIGADPSGLRVRIGYQAGEDGAAASAEAVLADDKSNCDALMVRAAEALRLRRPVDAVNAAQVVTAECPDRDGYDLLARGYAGRDDAAGVRRAFLDGIAARPLSTAAAAGYVGYLVARGQAENAANIARSLTQRAPAKVSGWRLLKAVCTRAPTLGCTAEAATGEAAARRNFAIDLPPGERRPNPLLGNSWK